MMKRYLPIELGIPEFGPTEIFAFGMMFEPEDFFRVFSYVSTGNIMYLRVSNSSFVCYQ